MSIALFLTSCGSTQPKPQIQTYPNWYKDRTIHATVSYEIIGYGEGKSIKEAEALAKEDIAQTLVSKIDSSVSIIKSSSANEYNKNSVSKLTVSTNLNLHNLKTIKQELSDDVFYVALQYQNLDLAHRIKTDIGHPECM